MNATHTPGPWRAEGYENLVVNSRDGFTILACPGSGPRAPLAELKANARLIASAPELLAFARMVMTQAAGDLSAEEFRCYVANQANVVVQRATGGAL